MFLDEKIRNNNGRSSCLLPWYRHIIDTPYHSVDDFEARGLKLLENKGLSD